MDKKPSKNCENLIPSKINNHTIQYTVQLISKVIIQF